MLSSNFQIVTQIPLYCRSIKIMFVCNAFVHLENMET
jgi:hypothetical protein